jgi:hypothetical protein
MSYRAKVDLIAANEKIAALTAENSGLQAELHLLEEVCAFYVDDEHRHPAGGEAYGSIPTPVGMKARHARERFREREAAAGAGQLWCVYVYGPCDAVPAPDAETAAQWVERINDAAATALAHAIAQRSHSRRRRRGMAAFRQRSRHRSKR